MDPSLTSGQSVEKDRLIGETVSSESQILFANLQGQLNKARASLQMLKTGQKEAVQKEAAEALNYAKTQLDVFLPQYERNKKLHRQTLISDEEWELSVKTEELLRQNIQLQQAKLQVVQSGEKRETVRMTEEDIDRLESQLKQLQRKISLGQIRTPIAGVFSNASRDSVLCRVSRLDSVVCTLMLRSDQIPFVRPGQTVAVRDPEADFKKTGTVFTIDQKCSSVSGHPVFFLTVPVDNAGGGILPGMLGRAAVFTDRVSLAERVRRAWIRRAGQIYL
jgi:multidrug resistance efflux pump